MSSYEHRTTVRPRLAVIIKMQLGWGSQEYWDLAGLSCPLVAVGSTASFTGVHFNFTQVKEDFILNLKTTKVEAQEEG